MNRRLFLKALLASSATVLMSPDLAAKQLIDLTDAEIDNILKINGITINFDSKVIGFDTEVDCGGMSILDAYKAVKEAMMMPENMSVPMPMSASTITDIHPINGWSVTDEDQAIIKDSGWQSNDDEDYYKKGK